jgi:hypothetical protein
MNNRRRVNGALLGMSEAAAYLGESERGYEGAGARPRCRTRRPISLGN